MTTKEKILTVAQYAVNVYGTAEQLESLMTIKKNGSEFRKLSETSTVLLNYIDLAKKAQIELSSEGIESVKQTPPETKEFLKYFLDINRMQIQNNVTRVNKAKLLASETRAWEEQQKDWFDVETVETFKGVFKDDIVVNKKGLQERKDGQDFYLDKYRVLDTYEYDRIIAVRLRRPAERNYEIEIVQFNPGRIVAVRRFFKIGEADLNKLKSTVDVVALFHD